MDYDSASNELHDRELPRLGFDIAARDGLEKWSNEQGYVIATSHRSKGPVKTVFTTCCYATGCVYLRSGCECWQESKRTGGKMYWSPSRPPVRKQRLRASAVSQCEKGISDPIFMYRPVGSGT
jgi:hypothetical protein